MKPPVHFFACLPLLLAVALLPQTLPATTETPPNLETDITCEMPATKSSIRSVSQVGRLSMFPTWSSGSNLYLAHRHSEDSLNVGQCYCVG